MTVITPDELHDLIAPRVSPRETNRAHRRFRAGVDESNVFDRRDKVDNEFGDRILRERRGAEARSMIDRGMKRFRHARIAVPENHRTPREDVVDIAVSVDVDHPRAFRAFKNDRRSADAAERARGTVDAPGNQSQRFFKYFTTFVSIHRSDLAT